MNVEITKITKVESAGITKAFVMANVNGIEIRDIAVKEGSKGLFVAMPQRSYQKDGKTMWSNITYITDADERTAFEEIVLDAYRNA